MLHSPSQHPSGLKTYTSDFHSHNALQHDQSSTSYRQRLAQRSGKTHFQLAPGIFGPPSPATSSPSRPPVKQQQQQQTVNASLAVGSSSRGPLAQPQPQAFRRVHSEETRGRSRRQKELWAYSGSMGRRQTIAAIAVAQAEASAQEVSDLQQWLRENRPSSSVPPPQLQELTSHQSPSETDMAAALEYEQPEAAVTTLVPILSRPPLTTPRSLTYLEQISLGAETVDADGADEKSYLRPAQQLVAASASLATPPESLYTRSKLPVDFDDATRALWHELHRFRPISSGYARGIGAALQWQGFDASSHPPINASSSQVCPFAARSSTLRQAALASIVSRTFNWSSFVLPKHVSGSWYGVVFLSLRRPGSESTNLYSADRDSHEEAVSSGGLIFYWYGAPDALTGENLATCIWTSRDEAKEASRLPMHAVAAQHASKAYSKFELARYRIVKRVGETGVRIEAWEE